MRRLRTEKRKKPSNTPAPSDLYDVTTAFLGDKGIDQQRLIEAYHEAERQHEFTKKAFGGWSSLPLRSLGGMTGKEASSAAGKHASSDANLFEDTVVMPDYIRELIDEIGQGAGVLKVRLMRLEANRTIGEHKDAFSPGPEVARLHIPVITNPEVEFQVNRKPYRMHVGRLYCIDVSKLHAVFNKGTEDRIHLVFDLCINADIRKKLKIGVMSNSEFNQSK